MWLLALVAGLAALVTLTQSISRQVRVSSAERETLTAVGFSNGQSLHGDDAAGDDSDRRRWPCGDGAGDHVLRHLPDRHRRSFRAEPWRARPMAGACCRRRSSSWALLLVLTGIVLALTRSDDRCGACLAGRRRRRITIARASGRDRDPARLHASARRAGIAAGGAGRRAVHRRRAGRGDHIRRQSRPTDRSAVPLRVEHGRATSETTAATRSNDELAAALEIDPNVESLIFYAQTYATGR